MQRNSIEWSSMSQSTSAESGMRTTPQEVLDAATRLSSRQRLVVFVAFLAMLFEGVEVTIASFVFPEIVRDWNVTIEQVTFTVTAGVVGMAVGAVLAGAIADRVGRKVTVVAGVVLFGATTVAMALTSSFQSFAALRIVACLGLGAAIPVVISLVADSVPLHRRAQMVAMTFSGVAAGTIVSGFLSSAIIPAFGWPTLLVIAGTATVVFAPVIALTVPEPPASLMARGAAAPRVRRSLALLAPGCDLSEVDFRAVVPTDGMERRLPLSGVFSRRMVWTTLLLWLMFFVGLGSAFLLANYLPLMTKSEGFTAAQGGVIVGTFGWGALTGQVSISFAIKRFDRFKILGLLWLLGLVGVLLVSTFTFGFAGYLIVAFGLGLTVGSASAALNATGALAYPSAMRATGVGWANAAGRAGTLLSGLLGGAMLGAGWSISHIIGSLAAPMIIGIVAVLILRIVSLRQIVT